LYFDISVVVVLQILLDQQPLHIFSKVSFKLQPELRGCWSNKICNAKNPGQQPPEVNKMSEPMQKRTVI
jgi:hypothetical protein